MGGAAVRTPSGAAAVRGPYVNNPRLHSEADLDKIRASVLGFGLTNPVLVDEDGGLTPGSCVSARQ